MYLSYRFPYINAEVLSGVINCISDRARFLGFAYVISLTISIKKEKQTNKKTLSEEFQYPIEKLLNGKIDTIRIQIHDRSLSRLVTSMSKKWWVKLVLEAQTHKRDNSSPTIFINQPTHLCCVYTLNIADGRPNRV
jgi:hypothetical protein